MRFDKFGFIIGIGAPAALTLAIAVGIALNKAPRIEPPAEVAPIADMSAVPMHTEQYVAMFQHAQRNNFTGVREALRGLEPYGGQLEKRFQRNPVRVALDSLDGHDSGPIVSALHEIVVLDIQNGLLLAEEQLQNSPDTAFEAVQRARLNYQVLALFAPPTDPDLNESIKQAFLNTAISVKSEAATAGLLRSYADEIQAKLRQVYPSAAPSVTT
jgi:hypothetical protein